ncbi:hypothetical protein A28LD_0576 [Idiomarina sp. A28L]|uniref:hypothetical protein n=1 Tax=Idiomarina sp. A28L TaxID=1036674 RepID=UPI0002138DA2|nr:hypothetical protein [Idiomarina sp. A28L]EGN76088.1 hypothetical protein A28LD_0576 [Idiomarina sp. A28L]
MISRIKRFPRRYRALVLLLLVILTYLLLGSEMLRYLGMWTLILFLLFPEMMSHKIPADKTKDMLGLLSREEDRLRVGMEQVAISIVRKVAIDEYDNRYGIISFPYTNKISASYYFPIEQLPAVCAWFKENAPELEIVR